MVETLRDILGGHPATCGHEETKGYSSITYVVPSEGEDWVWITSKISDKEATAVKVCSNCQQRLPSRRREDHRGRVNTIQNRIEEAQEQIEQLKDLYDPVWCENCDSYHEEQDLIQVRECPHCEEFFDGTNSGRNCEQCNRPFTRKVHERGCPDQPGEDELPLAVTDIQDRIKQCEVDANKAQAKLTLFAKIDPLSHYTDTHCDVDSNTGLCRECGVHHGDKCDECKRRAYHRFDCSKRTG